MSSGRETPHNVKAMKAIYVPLLTSKCRKRSRSGAAKISCLIYLTIVVGGTIVLCERDAGTDDTSQVENSPEDSDEFALLRFRGVRHHEGLLCGPQKTSTNAKNSTCANDEWTCFGVDVHGAASKYQVTTSDQIDWMSVQERTNVQGVPRAAKKESDSRPKSVIDRSSKESSSSECGV